MDHPEEVDDERASPASKKKRTALDELLGPEEAQCQEEQGGVLDEVAQYFTEKPATRETKPLLWWKMNSDCFPRLAKLARIKLCIFLDWPS